MPSIFATSIHTSQSSPSLPLSHSLNLQFFCAPAFSSAGEMVGSPVRFAVEGEQAKVRRVHLPRTGAAAVRIRDEFRHFPGVDCAPPLVAIVGDVFGVVVIEVEEGLLGHERHVRLRGVRELALLEAGAREHSEHCREVDVVNLGVEAEDVQNLAHLRFRLFGVEEVLDADDVELVPCVAKGDVGTVSRAEVDPLPESHRSRFVRGVLRHRFPRHLREELVKLGVDNVIHHIPPVAHDENIPDFHPQHDWR
mmetsp:Transcript_19348/g.62951  ORF Transcript_19348/g.62951 Transcript_19348/m.62951 type:complete len:251 (+) Transcript_19348:1332-2084(+)